MLIVWKVSVTEKTASLHLLQTSRHTVLKYISFVYLTLSPAAVAFLLLQSSPWLNDANPHTGERAFHITGAPRCCIMCCKVQSDVKKFAQVQTIGLSLPRHFESRILINDHRHKGTFTPQQPAESAVYIRVCMCARQGFFFDKWTVLFSAAEFYLKWIPAGY